MKNLTTSNLKKNWQMCGNNTRLEIKSLGWGLVLMFPLSAALGKSLPFSGPQVHFCKEPLDQVNTPGRPQESVFCL